ncbi:MAG: hypothetical protein ACRCV9_14255 [Burkholderiaceae bacterium]
MKTFFKWVGFIALACVVLSAALLAIGMVWGDFGHSVHVSVGGDSIAVERLSDLPWSHTLMAWLAIAFALLVVVTVVPMSLLFAFCATAVALAVVAALLVLPAALMAAPFAFILWLVWFRKRKQPTVLPPAPPAAN